MSKKEKMSDAKLSELLQEGIEYKEYLSIEMLGKKYGMSIRPARINEWNDSLRKQQKENVPAGLTIVAKCLEDVDGTTFTPAQIEKIIPAGVIDDLYRKIGKISGFDIDNDEKEMKDKFIEEQLKKF